MPTSDPRQAFDPSNFQGRALCAPPGESPLLQCGNADLEITLHVNGDGGAYFSLALGRRGKEIIAFMGAAEWPSFLRRVELAKAYYAALVAGGKCDEVTPCPPAG